MVRTTRLRCVPVPITTVFFASTRTTTLRRARETVRARMTTVPALRTVRLTLEIESPGHALARHARLARNLQGSFARTAPVRPHIRGDVRGGCEGHSDVRGNW